MATFLRTLMTLSAVIFLSFGAMAQPANDDCADAMAIGTVTDFSFSTIDATTDGPFHPGACEGGLPDSMYYDIWYLYTADFTGEAECTTCGTADFDTNIAAYVSGSCPTDDSGLLGCSEDATGCDNSTSRLVWDIVDGETYLIRIGGWGSVNSPGGEQGTGTFTIQEYIPVAGPPNDDCDGAIVLDLGPEDSVSVMFSTAGATTSEPIHDGTDGIVPGCLDPSEPAPYNDLWYSFTPDFTGYVEYSDCGTSVFDSKIAAYGPDPTCPPAAASLIGCGDDGCPNFTSSTNFPVVEGSTYLLRMGAFSSTGGGGGTFTVKQIPPPVPPPNDACATPDSAWVSPLDQADDFDPVFQSFTYNAAGSVQAPQPSCMQGNEYGDVWFKFNSGFNTTITFRILKINLDATAPSQFVCELYNSCLTKTDEVDGPGFCFNTVDSGLDLVAFEADNFPGEPTEYLVRVASDFTFENPGDFLLQILGEEFVGTDEAIFGNFKFYPNPVSEILNVQFDLEEAQEAKTEIVNSLGQTVQSEQFAQLGAGAQHLQVPTSELNPGIYFFRLLMENGEKTVRFVKK